MSAQAQEFLSWFGQEFQTVTGSSYMATFGKENKLAGEMIGLFGLEELKRRALLFLQDREPFVRASRTGYWSPEVPSQQVHQQPPQDGGVTVCRV